MTRHLPRPLPRRIVLKGVSGAGILAWLSGCSGTPDAAPTTPATTSPEIVLPTTTPTSTLAASAPPPAPIPAGTINVLVIGSDSRTLGALDGRSDVITLVQLSGDRKRVNMVSVARDTAVDLPGGGRGKINEAYARKGAAGLVEVVSTLLDLQITYTLSTNFGSFIALSDLLGGFTVQNRFASDSSRVVFPKGPILLKGPKALTYVRERHGLPNGDLDRTERHRAALTAILQRLHDLAVKDPTLLAKLVPNLFAQIRSNGLTVQQAVGMIPLVKTLTSAQVTSVMVPVTGFGTINGGSVDLVNAPRTAELKAALKAADLSAYVAKYGVSNAPTG
jgi:LCP family protein required for cell wall assembly